MSTTATTVTSNSDAASGERLATLSSVDEPGGTSMRAGGDWTCAGLHSVDRPLRQLSERASGAVSLDLSFVKRFDSAGAWIIHRLARDLEARGATLNLTGLDDERRKLVEVVASHSKATAQPHKGRSIGNPLEKLGIAVTGFGKDAVGVFNIIGASLRGNTIKGGRRGGIRVTSFVNQLDHMALRAIPVIAVMSFLIGGIIAQQSAYQLKFFGEELLTVNLVGILHLREIGVLLTAVMVAGRTGSAITAEIGSMKMREEIDALRVIGLNPIGILVVPRLMALIIAMPILTLLADVAGLLGAMLVTWIYIDIQPNQFLVTLRSAIDHTTLLAGLIKAPFMALVIGLIATIEGLKVKGSAESLGQRTTAAVVRSIFAVIVIDGFFAIFYASIDF